MESVEQGGVWEKLGDVTNGHGLSAGWQSLPVSVAGPVDAVMLEFRGGDGSAGEIMEAMAEGSGVGKPYGQTIGDSTRTCTNFVKKTRCLASVPRASSPAFDGRRRGPDSRSGERSLRHGTSRRRRSRTTRPALQPRLRRRQARAQRDGRGIFVSVDRLGRGRARKENFRDTGREDGLHRRRREDERTRRPPPHGPRLRVHLRSQPYLRTRDRIGPEIRRPGHQV